MVWTTSRLFFSHRPDQIGLSDRALLEDGEHRGGVIIRVDPIAHVLASAVEPGADPVDDVGDLPGDELLHVLPGAVVVRAVREGGLESERTYPRTDQEVAARLGRGIGAGRVVGGLRGELGRIIQLEVAIDSSVEM